MEYNNADFTMTWTAPYHESTITYYLDGEKVDVQTTKEQPANQMWAQLELPLGE